MTQDTPAMSLIKSTQKYMSGVSIDCVVFGYHNNQLKVLLTQFNNTDIYALPGGFVYLEESMDDAAQRILEERTNVKDIYLEQFYVFGKPDRLDPSIHQNIMKKNGVELDDNHWLLKRFISIGYYALVDFDEVQLSKTTSLSEISEWFSIDNYPCPAFDHNEIIQKALETLRLNLDNKLVGSNLMPETFTMNELQGLYETIIDKKLLRTNFQRKMLSLGILERIEKKWGGGAHKAPYLYRFSK